MMRGRLRGDPDFAQAANAAIAENTGALEELISTQFGESAAEQFGSIWATHVTALFNYARGVADDDTAVRDEARDTLQRYEAELAEFLADASGGDLQHDVGEAALHTHIEQVLQQADAYAAGDYAEANRIYRSAYAHTFALGASLGQTLFGASDAALAKPTWRLRSELTKLLGEHVAVVVPALRAGAADAEDFNAAAASVDANSQGLAGAVDVLFGADAAESFQALWADHVDALMTYTAGVVGDDPDQRSAAQDQLEAFEAALAEFLDSATEGRLSSDALAEALLGHDRMLSQAVDAFAAEDYQEAHDITYTTYQHMVDLASQLANAFGPTVAARLPQGGAETGEGGMAAVVGRR